MFTALNIGAALMFFGGLLFFCNSAYKLHKLTNAETEKLNQKTLEGYTELLNTNKRMLAESRQRELRLIGNRRLYPWNIEFKNLLDKERSFQKDLLGDRDRYKEKMSKLK